MNVRTHINQLIKNSGNELQAEAAEIPSEALFQELWENLLSKKNGFYAFEGAIFVRPLTSVEGVYGIIEWNSATLWRGRYANCDNLLFFAENIFGEQYALSENGIVLFDPELGETRHISDDLEGWAKELLADPSFWTGHPLAHLWQVEHGELPKGMRLIPKQPFVLGGNFEVSNLVAKQDAVAMRIRSDLASKLRELPDGATVEFVITE